MTGDSFILIVYTTGLLLAVYIGIDALQQVDALTEQLKQCKG